MSEDLLEHISLMYYDYLEKYDDNPNVNLTFKDVEDAYYEAFERGWKCIDLKTVLNQLYKECEHGDQEHKDWLKNKFDEFYNKIINE